MSLRCRFARRSGFGVSIFITCIDVKGVGTDDKSVAVRSGHRHFLDFLRQIGSNIEFTDLKDSVYDLTVRSSKLKATRIAGTRTKKILSQIILLAVLATRISGEVLVREADQAVAQRLPGAPTQPSDKSCRQAFAEVQDAEKEVGKRSGWRAVRTEEMSTA